MLIVTLGRIITMCGMRVNRVELSDGKKVLNVDFEQNPMESAFHTGQWSREQVEYVHKFLGELLENGEKSNESEPLQQTLGEECEESVCAN